MASSVALGYGRTVPSVGGDMDEPDFKAPRTRDPMERIVEEALIAAGVNFLTDHGGQNSTRLDFELPDHGLSI